MFSPYQARVKMPVSNQICWWQKGSKSAPVDQYEFWTKKYPWGKKYSHGNSWFCACVRQIVPMPNPKNFRGILPHSPYWRLPHVDRQLTEVFSTKKKMKRYFTAASFPSTARKRPSYILPASAGAPHLAQDTNTKIDPSSFKPPQMAKNKKKYVPQPCLAPHWTTMRPG